MLGSLFSDPLHSQYSPQPRSLWGLHTRSPQYSHDLDRDQRELDEPCGLSSFDDSVSCLHLRDG